MITPSNITRHELIGLEIKVVRSRNQSLTGKQGKVVDETRNTLIIEENGKRAKLPKQDIVFQAKIHKNNSTKKQQNKYKST